MNTTACERLTFGVGASSHRWGCVKCRLAVKCVFSLSEGEASSHVVIPGGHLHDTLPEPEALPRERITLPANSCLLLDRRMWHAVAPPASAPRISCTMGLG